MFVAGSIFQILMVMAIVIGSGAFVYKTWHDTTRQYDDETIERFKNAITALEEENKRLRNQLIELQQHVKALETTNETLKNIALGKDVLANIQGTLNKFEFIIPLITQFEQNDKLIMEQLTQLQKGG